MFSVLTGIQEIPVLYYFETKETKTIIAKAWNGILYRLVKSETPTIQHPTELTRNKSDEGLTGPAEKIEKYKAAKSYTTIPLRHEGPGPIDNETRQGTYGGS